MYPLPIVFHSVPIRTRSVTETPAPGQPLDVSRTWVVMGDWDMTVYRNVILSQDGLRGRDLRFFSLPNGHL